MRIIVNAQDHTLISGVVSYSLIAELANGAPTERDYTITYRRGPDNGHGTLTRGNILEACDGMVFTVAETGDA